MAQLLDDEVVKNLPPPAAGYCIIYDSDVKGFGIRVTAGGARSFILNYRNADGRDRRYTIGSFPAWKIEVKKGAVGARDRAMALKREIDAGGDPVEDQKKRRDAPTVATLCKNFSADHLPGLRATTSRDYQNIIDLHILPRLGSRKVASIETDDIRQLHATVAKSAPYRANRVLAVLSSMMAFAVENKMRADNPAKGVGRAAEERRERHLKPAEIARVAEAVADLKHRPSANAIRLLLLTGARRSEVLKARWTEFDLESGVWVKPSAHTKTKKLHRIPLSAPARVLLSEMKAEADTEVKRGGAAEFLFPGDDGKPITDIKRSWASVCRKAGLGQMVERRDAAGKAILDANGAPALEWEADARLHDLRHTYASILASHGLSLPVIGQLLGHTQAQTTHRYAHFLDDPLRAATERVGAVVSGAATGAPTADVVPIRRAGG